MPFPADHIQTMERTLPSTDHWQAFRDTYIEHVNKDAICKSEKV